MYVTNYDCCCESSYLPLTVLISLVNYALPCNNLWQTHTCHYLNWQPVTVVLYLFPLPLSGELPPLSLHHQEHVLLRNSGTVWYNNIILDMYSNTPFIAAVCITEDSFGLSSFLLISWSTCNPSFVCKSISCIVPLSSGSLLSPADFLPPLSLASLSSFLIGPSDVVYRIGYDRLRQSEEKPKFKLHRNLLLWQKMPSGNYKNDQVGQPSVVHELLDDSRKPFISLFSAQAFPTCASLISSVDELQMYMYKHSKTTLFL